MENNESFFHYRFYHDGYHHKSDQNELIAMAVNFFKSPAIGGTFNIDKIISLVDKIGEKDHEFWKCFFKKTLPSIYFYFKLCPPKSYINIFYETMNYMFVYRILPSLESHDFRILFCNQDHFPILSSYFEELSPFKKSPLRANSPSFNPNF